MRCLLQRRPDGWRCTACGRLRFGPATDCETRRCVAPCDSATPTKPPAGLGDLTERALAGMGVTEDRYKAIKQRFGLMPTCNCRDRKEWLNMVGKHLGLGAKTEPAEG